MPVMTRQEVEMEFAFINGLESKNKIITVSYEEATNFSQNPI